MAATDISRFQWGNMAVGWTPSQVDEGFDGEVHVLRGNHENENLNERSRSFGGGFAEECLAKYGPRGSAPRVAGRGHVLEEISPEPRAASCQAISLERGIYERFQQLFLLLPLFAVIEQQIFVVHGGDVGEAKTAAIQTSLPTGTDQRALEAASLRGRPKNRLVAKLGLKRTEVGKADEEILFDAQWADPADQPGITRSSRGSVVISFGPDITEKFLKDNNLSLCIRSHQVPKTMDGYELLHNGRLLTIFSASRYAQRFHNSGAVALLHRGATTLPEAKPALAMRFESGLQLHCVEHDVPPAAYSSGDGTAMSAAKGLARFDAGAEQEM
eukprot:Skav236016  [mRNA]  locus=scaffold3189:166322:173659:- [translate_table: standard]